MKAIKIKKRLTSETLRLPELKNMIGKNVEILFRLKLNMLIPSQIMLPLNKYEGEWNKLFKPLINSLKAFDNFLLVTDGDTSILKGLGGVKIIF